MEANLSLTVGPVKEEEQYQMIKFIGEFDKAGHAEVREELEQAVENFSSQSLIFDFANLKFINSEGIGYIMEVHTHLTQIDKELVILGVNAHIEDVFRAVGIYEIVPIYQDLDEFLSK